MDELQLLVDLHRPAARQGPGGEAETLRALELTGIDRRAALRIADVGCGTGASTLVLAQHTNASITAIDFLEPFLEELEARAERAGVPDRIATRCCSMDALPFEEESLDVIWSEGAIYNIGFERGIDAWRRSLRPGGVLVASEITWLTASRPTELEQHWRTEYPEIAAASVRFALLEQYGYVPIGYFVLPEHCWLEHYYRPMQARFDEFLARNDRSDAAQAIVAAERREIDLYERHRAHFSYGVYIARKTDTPA
ncbi:MAG: class I SAM-dependent methyltransferase [Pseudomonadales bacterium]|nr:class I SAM-dependent methyltransferase [Pseudomonadales bacterium]